jgi:hypothetical protein
MRRVFVAVVVVAAAVGSAVDQQNLQGEVHHRVVAVAQAEVLAPPGALDGEGTPPLAASAAGLGFHTASASDHEAVLVA